MRELSDLYYGNDPEEQSMARKFAGIHLSWEEAEECWRQTVMYFQHKVRTMEEYTEEEQDEYAEWLAFTHLWKAAKDDVCHAPRKPFKG
ncbi:hypothetical protein [Streptomyces avermitilis]|uniref:hypothetical protein n=1 Tax=Streptomyces avermitilis TaxID=33903 RepID=UPI0036B0ED95